MQDTFGNLAERLGPINSAMAAALSLILGVAVILNPALLSWIAGIGLILFSVAILTSVLISNTRQND